MNILSRKSAHSSIYWKSTYFWPLDSFQLIGQMHLRIDWHWCTNQVVYVFAHYYRTYHTGWRLLPFWGNGQFKEWYVVYHLPCCICFPLRLPFFVTYWCCLGNVSLDPLLAKFDLEKALGMVNLIALVRDHKFTLTQYLCLNIRVHGPVWTV